MEDRTKQVHEPPVFVRSFKRTSIIEKHKMSVLSLKIVDQLIDFVLYLLQCQYLVLHDYYGLSLQIESLSVLLKYIS